MTKFAFIISFAFFALSAWILSGVSVGECHTNATGSDQFHENLFVKTLDDGQILVQFRFRTLYRKSLGQLSWENRYQLFPFPIAQLISDAQLSEMHFSLTRGNWNYEQWGYPSRSSPAGAQLWVKFRPYSENPQRAWRRLVSALSGRFCASLSSIDEKSTSHPRYSFEHNNKDDQIYYSNFVDEPLCTENLTPWKKLLPCSDKSGLASLLHAEHLFKSTYSSMAIDFLTRPNVDYLSGKLEDVELTQTLTVVINAVRLFDGKQSWSLAKLFGTQLKRTCPVTSSSEIEVETTGISDDIATIMPKSFKILEIQRKQATGDTTNLKTYVRYDTQQLLDNARLANKTQANIGVRFHNFHKFTAYSSLASLLFSTHVAGVGTYEGTIVATIRNSYPESINISYYDVIPDFLRIYSHTLRIKNINDNNCNLKPQNLAFVPSQQHVRSAQLEFQLAVPKHSIVEISYDFKRLFLRWNEYRPDANRGVLLGSAVLGAKIPLKYCSDQHVLDPSLTLEASNSTVERFEDDKWLDVAIYARPLLIVMPTPDFSMPYNVLCLVTTVMVAIFGPLHGFTTQNKI